MSISVTQHSEIDGQVRILPGQLRQVKYLPGGRKKVSKPITALLLPSTPFPSDSPFRKLSMEKRRGSVRIDQNKRLPSDSQGQLVILL